MFLLMTLILFTHWPNVSLIVETKAAILATLSRSSASKDGCHSFIIRRHFLLFPTAAAPRAAEIMNLKRGDHNSLSEGRLRLSRKALRNISPD